MGICEQWIFEDETPTQNRWNILYMTNDAEYFRTMLTWRGDMYATDLVKMTFAAGLKLRNSLKITKQPTLNK